MKQDKIWGIIKTNTQHQHPLPFWLSDVQQR